MDAPDKGLPHGLLETAKCIAIIPGDKSLPSYSAVATVAVSPPAARGHGWSAPMFVAIDGSSVGYQIGGSSTDIILLFMNDRALHSLLSDKFKLGADASVAAGPVGRDAAASTDLNECGDSLLFAPKASLLESASTGPWSK